MIIFRSTSGLDGGAKGRLAAEEGLVHGAVSARELSNRPFVPWRVPGASSTDRSYVKVTECKLNQPFLRQIY